ncbi:cytochrome P450 2A4-like isoform X2 [Haemaphysalis longicornis]
MSAVPFSEKMDWAVAAVAAGAVLVLALMLFVRRYLSEVEKQMRIPKGTKIPPGPASLPVIGHLPTLLTGFGPEKCLGWACRYGPIVRVKAGSSEMIILNDRASIEKFLSHQNLLYRSLDWEMNLGINIGFSGFGGHAWDENRNFSLKLLRELGFAKSVMKNTFSEGCELLMERIAKERGKALDIVELLMDSLSNNVGVFVFGRRLEHGHPKRKGLSWALLDQFSASRSGGVLGFRPDFVRSLAQRLSFTRSGSLVKAMTWMEKFFGHQLTWHRKTLGGDENRDYMDAYLRKREGRENDETTTYSLACIVGNAMGLMIAGSNTVTAVLQRHLLLLAAYPDTVQARIQEEIDAVIGCERPPAWEDRHAMPFTMATILECHRWHTLLPMGVPRRAQQDTIIGGYFLPKDTTVLANVWAVHHDPRRWYQPEKFDPTRFLKKDGSLACDKAQEIIPFSVGRRMCPGEIFASVEIFLYLTGFLQKFRVLPQEGCVVDIHVHDTFVLKSNQQKLRFFPRVSRPLFSRGDRQVSDVELIQSTQANAAA